MEGSELRRRGGEEPDADAPRSGPALAAEPHNDPPAKRPMLYMGGGADFGRYDVEDIIRLSAMPKSASRLPSMSNASKRVKDMLTEDPYNVELIAKLGLIYASEGEWEKCCNVMLRGWKRVSELQEPGDRFDFLMKLSEASYNMKKYRQAAAVLADVEGPESRVERKAFELLSCHVYCALGESEAPKALATFGKAIEGEDFDSAVKIWAATALQLKKVGAYEGAKTALMQRARGGQHHYMDQAKLQTVDSWAIMSCNPATTTPAWEKELPRWLIGAAIFLSACLVLYLLYRLERASLESWKFKTP